MKQTLYLHIGLPKTGTSFLQSKVFPRLQGIHSISRNHIYDGNDSMNDIRQQLQYCSSSHISTVASEIEEQILGLLPEGYTGDFVYSDESMTSPFMDPKINEFQKNYYAALTAETFFSNLDISIQPFEKIQIKLIILVRNQNELIHSWYAQKHHRFVQRHGMETFDDYLNLLFSPSSKRYGGEVYDFEAFHSMITRTFKSGEVAWFSFHQILENKNLEPLLKFIGAKNDRDSIEEISGQKAVNQRSKADDSKRKSSLSSHGPIVKSLLKIKKRIAPELKMGIGKHVKEKSVEIEYLPEQKLRIEQFFNQSNLNFLKATGNNKDFLKL